MRSPRTSASRTRRARTATRSTTGPGRIRTHRRAMAGLILAGDVGGTNTRLGLYSWAGGRPRQEAMEVYASGAHPELEEIVVAFMARHRATLCGACVGIAGPVRDNKVY